MAGEPSDDEIVKLLLNKVNQTPLPGLMIPDCDVNGDEEPWQIWDRLGGATYNNNGFLYVFCRLKRRRVCGSNIKRNVGSRGGIWQGEDSEKVRGIGWTRKSFLYRNRKNCGEDGCWVMQQYSVDQCDSMVLCRIKSNHSKRKPDEYASDELELKFAKRLKVTAEESESDLNYEESVDLFVNEDPAEISISELVDLLRQKETVSVGLVVGDAEYVLVSDDHAVPESEFLNSYLDVQLDLSAQSDDPGEEYEITEWLSEVLADNKKPVKSCKFEDKIMTIADDNAMSAVPDRQVGDIVEFQQDHVSADHQEEDDDMTEFQLEEHDRQEEEDDDMTEFQLEEHDHQEEDDDHID